MVGFAQIDNESKLTWTSEIAVEEEARTALDFSMRDWHEMRY